MCALQIPAEHAGAARPARRSGNRTARPGRPAAKASRAAQPKVWVLAATRPGDASQVMALAEALGWPFEVKRLALRPLNLLLAPPFATTDAGIDRARSSELTPPWPDLVLASGRENEPVARWIKAQSGGRTRIVQVGRPWGPIAAYDLVVTTPQYRLPARPNVLENAAPLHRITPERLTAAAARWSDRLMGMPRPLVAVLVGGNSGPYGMTRRSGARLAAAADAMAASLGGSLLVTTSSRTPRAATRALADGLKGPHLLYRWRRGDADNPYFAFLALADEIIVTADSMSMLSEALATGKRVHLFDLGEGWSSMRAPLAMRGEDPVAPPRLREWLADFTLRPRLYRWLLRLAPSRVTRDIRLVHQQLVESGRASWLGEAGAIVPPPPLEDVARAVARVRGLMAKPVVPGDWSAQAELVEAAA